MIAILTVGSLLDFFGLAAFLPLIYLIADPNALAAHPWLLRLYQGSGFKSAVSFYAFLIGVLLVFIVIKTWIASAITRKKANYVFSLGSELSVRMLAKYSTMPWLDFTRSDHTKEINRIANQPIAFANNIILPLGTLLSEGIVFIILLISVAAYSIKPFLFLSVLIAPVLFVYTRHRRLLQQTGIDLKNNYEHSLKYATQVVEGLADVRSAGKEDYFRDRFSAISQTLSKTFAIDHSSHQRSARITELVATSTLCLLVLYAILAGQHYQDTIVLLAIYAGVSFRLLPSFNRILHSIMQIRTHTYLFQELGDIPFLKSHSDETIAPLHFEDSLIINNISFHYPERPIVLNNINLKIGKGEKIALTGKSGVGKTTLHLIFLQFLTPQTGSLSIDGADSKSFSAGSWNSLFAYVPQTPYILDGTLTENIAFGIPPERIDTDKIKRILSELNLSDLLDQLPQGLSTQLGEKGIRLSGGQRQRVAIARALYSDAEILLLDEITSQLDKVTELEIIATLEKLVQQKKTIIMITHHEALLSYFDRVAEITPDGLSVKIPS